MSRTEGEGGFVSGGWDRDARRFRDLARLPSDRWTSGLIGDIDAAVRRLSAAVPSVPSPVMRLAAVAHGFDDPDEWLISARARLITLSSAGSAPATDPDRDLLLFAALACFDQVDYLGFESSRGSGTALRDSLTDPEDADAVARILHWDTMLRLTIRTPDDLLRSWRAAVEVTRDRPYAQDPSEYFNSFDVRSRLQTYLCAISWAGHQAWRPWIEPADDLFRASTRQRDVPLVLRADGRPGEWWRYRLPAGEPPSAAWRIRGTEERDFKRGNLERLVSSRTGPGGR